MMPFPKGARVVFIGDSITAACNYTTRVVEFYKKHLPELSVKFKNSAVSGGSCGSAMLYYEADVLPFRPTHATIFLGVNDSGRDMLKQPRTEARDKALAERFEMFKARYTELLDRLERDDIIPILITPAPYAEHCANCGDAFKGGHELLRHYADFIRGLARERGYDVIDFHARLSELYLDEALYNPDRVHPNDRGHWRMAEYFLASQGLETGEYRSLDEVKGDARIGAWSNETMIMRRLYAAEWMVIRDFSKSFEEKMEIAHNYLAAGKFSLELFRVLTEEYLVNKPREAEIVAGIDGLMARMYE